MSHAEYLIIGAGPTGIGAAYQLKRLGISSFLVLEVGDRVGGLSTSYQDDMGFTWDLGGHILFSQNDLFIRWVKEIMGDDLLSHNRCARIRIKDRWIDYPFQSHIDQLDDGSVEWCRNGLLNSSGPCDLTHTFKDWIEHSFGDGICALFMSPYNRKVWAFPLDQMGFQWIENRVSVVSKKNKGHDDLSSNSKQWGPNSTFRYPKKGGIGDIFWRLASFFQEHILLNHAVVDIDLRRQRVMTSNGRLFTYEKLLYTAPLDDLIRRVINPDQPLVQRAAKQLKHNSVHIVGIGVDKVGDCSNSWSYFPDEQCPFYRLTNLHNYSPAITPNEGRQSALMAEVATAPGQWIDENGLISSVIDGLMRTGILEPSDRRNIVSTWYRKVPYGYPIPTLERDDALAVIHPYLEQHNVHSRGRFGGWKYEVGNMDHSFMQGVEWVNRVVRGDEENIYTFTEKQSNQKAMNPDIENRTA